MDREAKNQTLPKLYRELAEWWPLFSPRDEYSEEASFYERLLLALCEPPCRTVLELGSGGGSIASYLRHRFEMTLVDLSPGMIEVSRA